MKESTWSYDGSSQPASSLWDLAAKGELNEGVSGHMITLLNLHLLFGIWQRRGELNERVAGHVMILLNLLLLVGIWQRKVS